MSRLTSKKKKNGSYLITVSCGRDSKDRKVSRSITYRPELFTAKGHPKTQNTIQKEVAAFAADFEKKVLAREYMAGATMTFEEYAHKYLEEYARNKQAPRTLQNTEAAIKQFVSDFGYLPLEHLTPLFLQEYTNKLFKVPKGNGSGTLSQGTVKRRMAVLSAMLSRAVRWHLLQSNPMFNVEVSQNDDAPDTDKIMCFNQEQAEVFLAALDNPLMYRYQRKGSDPESSAHEYQAKHTIQLQLKLFFYLAMFTGCRRGELIALQWSDIDFNESTVSITKSTCRVDGKTITKTTKTKGSVRTLAIPSLVVSLAKQWKTAQQRYRLQIGSKWEGDNYIFIQWNGRQMHLDTPYQAFHRIINNYNANRPVTAPELPLIPLHGLRHTSATLLIGQGVNVRTVFGRLGHSSTSTTMNIYAHALKELDKTASDKLESIFLKASV